MTLAASPLPDIASLRPSPHMTLLRCVWPLLTALTIGFIFQTHVSGFPASLVVDCGIAIIMAVSLTVVNGFTGQFSIGHAGFMAVGGYFAATIVYYGSYKLLGDTDNAAFHGGLLSVSPLRAADASAPSLLHPSQLLARGDLLFVLACLAAAILSAAVGWIVGLPSLRLRGDYLAIVTLGFGEIVRVVIQGTPGQLDSFSDPPVSDVSFA